MPSPKGVKEINDTLNLAYSTHVCGVGVCGGVDLFSSCDWVMNSLIGRVKFIKYIHSSRLFLY